MAKKKKAGGADTEETQYLPGTEPVKNDRVHNAAKRYARLRDARMAANKEEKDAHDTLLGTMTEEGLEYYKFKDVEVAIDSLKKCKVTNPNDKKKAAGSVNGDGDDEE